MTNGNIKPELTRCNTVADRSSDIDQFEVDLHYGSFVLRQTDLSIHDGFDVPLTRSYNSGEWLALNKMHAFGWKGSHPYDIAPLGTRNPYTYMEIALEDGDLLYFKRISKGTGYDDAVYMHTDTSTRFYGAILAWNGDGWTLTLKDGSKVIFPESYASTTLAQGAATEMQNASGEKLRITRDYQRNVKRLQTSHGHWIQFTCDSEGRIRHAWNDSGVSSEYVYSPLGLLLSMSRSDGKKRTYTYDGDRLLSVSDGEGKVLVENRYFHDMVIAQRYANGDTFYFQYAVKPNAKYESAVMIKKPDGSVETVQINDAVPEPLLSR